MPKTGNRFAHWIREYWLELLLVALLLAALLWIFQVGRGIWATANAEPTSTPTPRPLVEGRPTRTPTPLPAPEAVVQGFDGQRALASVASLVALGPRPLGSEAHGTARVALVDELNRAGWQVEEQTVDVGGVALRTVIGKAGSGPLVLLGTHYDTPAVADLDPAEANRTQPVPGANDGASGAAVLLELARSLDKAKLTNEVWLTFFDGQYPPAGGEPVSAGARSLAESLPSDPLPEAVVLLDFVGATEQRFVIDGNSDPALSQTLWSLGKQLGYEAWFVPETRAAADNGLLAFRQRSIPAANIAGPDYPYRRTVDDTVDKVDAASLERVGRLLQAYLEKQAPS